MKDYSTYTLKDFVLDKNFQQWIIAPNQENMDYWGNYLQSHPAQAKIIEEARLLIASIPFQQYQVSDAVSEQVWQKIQAQLGKEADTNNSVFEIHKSFKINQLRTWYRYAAVFLLLTLVGYSVYLFNTASNKVEYINQYGQIRQVSLPDGSKVMLNANSRLTYYKNWEKREVWLDGEGFFEVKKNSQAPANLVKFTVHTPELDVQVLGTEFNVKTRHRKTEVVLNAGKILLKKSAQQLNIEPGERVVATVETQKLEKQLVDTSLYSTWREQKFAFNNTKLDEVIEMLKDNYGYEIILKNADLGDKKISSTNLISTKDIDAFIQIVASLYQTDIVIEGKTIKISKK